MSKKQMGFSSSPFAIGTNYGSYRTFSAKKVASTTEGANTFDVNMSITSRDKDYNAWFVKCCVF